jgi:hypothetical protein
MAESNVIAPIFRWANWWIADDIFTGIDNSYFYSENVEIRENSKGISLSKKLAQATTSTDKINVIVKADTNLFIAWWASWVCKKCKNGNWSAVTTGINQARVSAAVFNDELYFCTRSVLYKVAVSDFSSSSVTPTKVDDLTSSGHHPMLVSQWDLYIWNWSKLSKVDTAGVFSDIFTMEKWWVITKLNDLWWAIRVITQSALWNSNIYLWDWVNSEPDETIPLIWYVTYQSQIFNGYPYLVTNRGLWILDWYKIYPLKKIEDFADIENWIAVYNERLVIAWTNGIYSRWAKNKNYNEVLSYDYVANGEVTAICSDGIDLFVAWKKTTDWWTTTYGIDKLSDEQYNTSWYLITRGYYANSLKEVKEWILAWIWYSDLVSGQSIEIQYSVNWWSFTSLRTITPTTDTIESFTEDLFVRDRFQYIQFKIILTWDGTNTPSFYALDFIFNNNVLR